MLNVLAETAQEIYWPIEIVRILGPGVVVLLGLWGWHHQKRSEPKYVSVLLLKQKRLESLLKAWGLLAYLSEVENPKAVLVWEDQGGDRRYFIRRKQADEFMAELSRMFYEGGCGLLLGKEVKRLFYEYRGHLHRVLLKSKSSGQDEELIRLENSGLAENLRLIYTEVNGELRKELEKMEK